VDSERPTTSPAKQRHTHSRPFPRTHPYRKDDTHLNRRAAYGAGRCPQWEGECDAAARAVFAIFDYFSQIFRSPALAVLPPCTTQHTAYS